MPNIVKICQSVAKIFRFFQYLKCEISLADSVRRPRLTIVLNFVKIGHSIAKILQFFNFKDGRCCHLGFLKSRNFIGYWGPEGRDASGCQILSTWLIGCEDIKIFRFSRWRPLPSWIFDIVNFYLLTVSGGPRRITIPNFVNRPFRCRDIAIF